MSILVFAPIKYLDIDYRSWCYLEYRNYPCHTLRFEEIAELELLEQCLKKYGSTKIKLIGYAYTQYDFHGWSYYPVQLVIKNKLKGIKWIKWQNRLKDSYFVLNKIYENSDNDYPMNFKLCSCKEETTLNAAYPQPYMPEIICSSKMLKLGPAAFCPSGVSFSFMFELQRQLTYLLANLTEIKDIYKYIILSFFSVMNVIYENGYGYAPVIICSKPFNNNKGYSLAVKWHGKYDCNIIEPTSAVDANTIVFELAQKMPSDYKNTKIDIFADKDKIIKIIQASGDFKRLKTGTYFPVYVCDVNYPNVQFEMIWQCSISNDMINFLYNSINRFIISYNNHNHGIIHDFEINKLDDKKIIIYIDFGNAEADALNSFILDIDKNVKNIKQIVMC